MSGKYKSLDHLLESDLGSDSRKIKNYLVERCGIEDDEKGQKEIDVFIRNWLVNIKLRSLLYASDHDKKVNRVKSLSPTFVIKLFRLAYRTTSKIASRKTANLRIIENGTTSYQTIFDKEIDEIRYTLSSKIFCEFLEKSFVNSPEVLKKLQIQ